MPMMPVAPPGRVMSRTWFTAAIGCISSDAEPRPWASEPTQSTAQSTIGSPRMSFTASCRFSVVERSMVSQPCLRTSSSREAS